MSEGSFSQLLLNLSKDSKIVSYAVIDPEKFLYVTKGFAKLLGYPEDKLKGSSLLDVFEPNFLDTLRSLSFNEENNDLTYSAKLRTYNNTIKVANIYVKRITFKNKPCLLLQVMDITKEEVAKTFYHLVSAINKSIIKATDEVDLFNQICSNLVSTKYIDLAWVFGFDGKRGSIVAYSGTSKFVEDSLQNIKDAILNFKNAPIYETLQTNKIVVIDNIETSNIISPYADMLLNYGYKSACYILIKKDDTHNFSLNIYSRITGYFGDYIIPALEEMQMDLNYFFKNYREVLYKRMFFEAIKNTKDWVLITDKDGTIEYANEAVSWISGYDISEIIGKKPSIFKSGKYDNSFYKSLWDTILLGKVYRGVIINKTKNGDYYQLYHTITPIETKGKITHFVAISKDISHELYLEEQIRKFRYYDQLTGLLNTDGFINRSEEIIEELNHINLEFSVFVVDIYEFNRINNVYGVNTADKLLKEIGKLLTSKAKVASRLGDDEFSLLITFKDKRELEDKINSIINLFKKPINVDNQSIETPINIGIAVLKNNLEIRNCITNANNAVTEAKHLGPYKFKVFDDNLNNTIHRDYQIKQLIRESLTNGYFTFYLQPIVRSDTFEIAEFESLARINHPQKGLIYPKDFIERLERSEYLASFEQYLTITIADYITQMEENTGKKVPIGINLSMSNLSTGKTLDIFRGLDSSLRENIKLEVTERIFSESLDKAKEILFALKDLGFHIMIDDFGTGYSSLSYIHTLPVDAIKIDISFVRDMMVDEKVKEIVRATVMMANALGFETVAEGIETKEQIDLLKEFGVTYLQGYYFSKPLPHKEAFSLLSKDKLPWV